MKFKPLLLFISLINSLICQSQVSQYYFTQSTSTYTSLTEETVLWSGTFDNEVSTITIPSTWINGNSYTSMTISSNGFITFGGESPAGAYYSPISGSTAYNMAISPFGIRLQNAETGTPKVSYNTNVDGDIVVQWQDVKRYSATGDVASFQARISAASGVIRIIYGSVTTTYNGTSYGVQVGLRGISNADFNNRSTTTDWASTNSGATNDETCRFNDVVSPATGLTLSWKPLFNPENFSSEAISNSQIELNWQQNGQDQDVMLAFSTNGTFGTPASGVTYSAGNEIPGGGTVLFYGDATSFSHTPLSSGTVYHYKIWSFDTVPDYSTGITTSTRTAYPISYLENFDAASFPEEWEGDMTIGLTHGILDTNGIKSRLHSSVTSAYATSPLVGGITASTQLSFFYRIVNYLGFPLNATNLGPNDKIEIQVSTNDGASFTTLYTIDQDNHSSSTGFCNKVISLAAYSGDYVKVRFLSTYGSGDYYVDIDHVLFENGTNMAYVGSHQKHTNLSKVAIGSQYNEMTRIEVVTQKGSNPIYLNTLYVSSFNGPISAARIYYTTGPDFSTAVQFGGVINNPDGASSFTGNQLLTQGINYFWLTYDIKTTASAGNTVDGYFSGLITSESGTLKTPANNYNPAGNRMVATTFTGTKTIPGDYATILAAVNALNLGIVGDGGVTFNVAAGHTENDGAALWLTTSGASGKPIIFQKSGSGANPLVTRTDAGGANPSVIGNHGDGVVILDGVDYVTFDGIDIATQNAVIEYGYYLRKISVTDACKHITIKNSTLNMTKGTSRKVAGICASNNVGSTNNAGILSPGGAHKAITITGNTILNSFAGIFVKGSVDFNDQDFVIGSTGAGNTIVNFASTQPYESWGIYVINTNGFAINYNNISDVSAGTGMVAGIKMAESQSVSFKGNEIFDIAGADSVYGIVADTGNYQVDIFKNTIYNLSSSSNTGEAGFVAGVLVSGGDEVNIFNNFISDLQAPDAGIDDAIRGIAITSTQENSSIGIYYNTIYLNATSTGTNFGSSGLFHNSSSTASTAALDLRNNIIINKSTPNGTSLVTAFRRSSSSRSNYKSISNNNIFYAGSPGTQRVVYYDGDTAQTIDAYRELAGPGRDSISFSQDPVFVNVSTTPYNLRLADGNISYCESGGRPITSPLVINDDFDGLIRSGTPDIGADEFAGTAAYVEMPSSFKAVATSPTETKLLFSAANNVMICSQTTSSITGNPVNGNVYNLGDPVPSAGTVIYKGPAGNFLHEDLDEWSQHFYRIWTLNNLNYYSIGIRAQAITDADTIESLPYLQDFGMAWTHIPAAPDQWKVVNADGPDTPGWREVSSYYYLSPSCAEGSGNGDDHLISPPIRLADTDCRLVWWDKVENAGDLNSYRVLLSTTGSEPDSFNIILDTVDCSNTVWTRHQIDLTDNDGQVIYLAFHQFYSASPTTAFAIDEVYVDSLRTDPEIIVNPSSNDFGTVDVDAESDPQPFMIRNRGAGILTITGTTLSGEDQVDFLLTDTNSYPISLGADEYITVEVTFSPGTAGARYTDLSVSHSGDGSPELVSLAGYSQAPSTFWLGTLSDEWGNPANWSDGVPGPNHEVTISSGTYDPIITSSISIYKITIASGAEIHLSSTGSLIVTGH